MGKRSDFERNDKDFYPTPYEAVLPLLPYLPNQASFIEPCAGDGRLIHHLERHGHKCVYACDLDPQPNYKDFKGKIDKQDVLFFGYTLPVTEFIITNPPWSRNKDGTGPLHEMIEAFRKQAPTWLLFDSDWMFTEQAKPFKPHCRKIISVGRVSWMGNGISGMDNCCWYLFDDGIYETIFI